MSLAKLKDLTEATATVEYGGQSWKVRKLTAAEGVAIHKLFDGKADNDPDALRLFFTELLAKCVLEDDGSQQLDTEEGRAALAKASLADLIALGDLCLDAWGATAKKNLASKSDSPTDSALASEASTQSTPTTS